MGRAQVFDLAAWQTSRSRACRELLEQIVEAGDRVYALSDEEPRLVREGLDEPRCLSDRAHLCVCRSLTAIEA
jgi:hypothetical protein